MAGKQAKKSEELITTPVPGSSLWNIELIFEGGNAVHEAGMFTERELQDHFEHIYKNGYLFKSAGKSIYYPGTMLRRSTAIEVKTA
jgi:hypothetical protein